MLSNVPSSQMSSFESDDSPVSNFRPMRQYGNGFWGGMGSEDSDGRRSHASDSSVTGASKKRKRYTAASVLVCVFLLIATLAVGGIVMGKKVCHNGIKPTDPTVSVTLPERDSSDVLPVDVAVTDAHIPDHVDGLVPSEEQHQPSELEEEHPVITVSELAEENGAVEQLRPETRSSRARKFLRKNWKPAVAGLAGAAAMGVGAHWIAHQPDATKLDNDALQGIIRRIQGQARERIIVNDAILDPTFGPDDCRFCRTVDKIQQILPGMSS